MRNHLEKALKVIGHAYPAIHRSQISKYFPSSGKNKIYKIFYVLNKNMKPIYFSFSFKFTVLISCVPLLFQIFRFSKLVLNLFVLHSFDII